MAHGQSVHDYFLDLKSHVQSGSRLRLEWKLPEWILSPALWLNLVPETILEEYQVFHDCGKPYCRTTDLEGRVHFPDHAAWSEAIWNQVGTAEAARLMGMDMDVHLLKGEGVADFAARPEAASLLITGFCEVHANAAMFGGIESTSFKMKWKHLDRRGKQISKLLL
jgi:hypothetical protein